MATDSAFGRVLSEYRKRRGMTRSQLAERSGLSYPYVSQLETGLRKPSRKAGAQLAAALGIDPLALEAALPSDDASSPSSERSLRVREALLSDRPGALDGVFASGSAAPTVMSLEEPSSDAPASASDVVHDVVARVEQLEPGERLDALAEVQRRVMQGLLDRNAAVD